VRAVLIAEENKVIRGLVRAIVQSAGFEPVETPSGEESFRMAQRGEYGAIVLDCLGRQGLETLKRLRAYRS
jgi:DNA-binding response OmpR family regulator